MTSSISTNYEDPTRLLIVNVREGVPYVIKQNEFPSVSINRALNGSLRVVSSDTTADGILTMRSDILDVVSYNYIQSRHNAAIQTRYFPRTTNSSVGVSSGRSDETVTVSYDTWPVSCVSLAPSTYAAVLATNPTSDFIVKPDCELVLSYNSGVGITWMVYVAASSPLAAKFASIPPANSTEALLKVESTSRYPYTATAHVTVPSVAAVTIAANASTAEQRFLGYPLVLESSTGDASTIFKVLFGVSAADLITQLNTSGGIVYSPFDYAIKAGVISRIKASVNLLLELSLTGFNTLGGDARFGV